MLATGEKIGDGSWELNVLVTDLNVQRKIRVAGDLHIGGVMFRLVEGFDEELEVQRDWSDHGLWWPERGKWLLNTRLTLDQCRINADHTIHFTPMHKIARVQLPDLQFMDVKVNFSVPVFTAVIQFCKEIGIRYPEELSFKYDVDPHVLKKLDPTHKPSELHFDRRGSLQNLSFRAGLANGTSTLPVHSQSAFNVSAPDSTFNPYSRGGFNSIARSPNVASTLSPGYLTLNGKPLKASSPVHPSHSHSFEGSLCEELDTSLTNTPKLQSTRQLLAKMFQPKNLTQKAIMNRGWLDSSISLFEQGVSEFDTILMRYRYLQFFDLNPKYDAIRINQIYNQGKWAVLTEEVDCTDEEMIMFATLQLQIQLETAQAQLNGIDDQPNDVESALDDLQTTLEGTAINGKQADITSIPELSDYLKYLKPKRLTLKGWKRAFFTFKDLYICYYASQDDVHRLTPLGRIHLKGCEVNPGVNLSQEKFLIKLLVPSADGMHEFWIRCFSKEQYSRWMAACKLAAKGKTMADSAYPAEAEALQRLLSMQAVGDNHNNANNNNNRQSNGTSSPRAALRNGHSAVVATAQDIDPEELLPHRALKRFRSRNALTQRILEAHKNVEDLSLSDAKLHFIRAWQTLPEFGIHYFIVRFRGARKTDLLGIAYNRLMRMSMETGEIIKTWRFSTMNRWHVNWEIRSLMIQCDDEEFIFEPLSCTCKTVHEFIGGYIYLAVRSKEQSQTVDEKLFFELTGGRPV